MLIGLSIGGSILEGIGISLFLPFFNQTEFRNQEDSSIPHQILLWVGVTPSFEVILMMIIAVFISKGVLQFATGAYQAYISASVVYDIRRRIVSLLSHVDYGFVSANNSGYLTNVLINEVSRTFSSILAFSKQSANIFTIIVFSAIVMSMNLPLMGAIMVFGFVMLLSLRTLSQMTKMYSTMQTDRNGVLSGLFVQLFQASKYLFSTNSFYRVENIVQDQIRRLRTVEYKPNVLVALSTALSQPASVIFMVCVVFVQVSILKGAIAPILVLMMYLYRIITEIMAFQNMWQTFNMSVGGVDVVVETIRQLSAHAEKVGTRSFSHLQDSIALESIDFGYGEKNVLHHTELSIRKNQTIAFVGSSGAGKSTLVDIITGLLKPTHGRITIDGTDLREVNTREYRSRIGYVTQDCVLFDDTIFHNISLWEDQGRVQDIEERVYSAARKAKCDEFILQSAQGYQTQVGERGLRLSGGQRQRLAIARELFKQPDILILDEATSALDSESENFIQESIRDLYGSMTVIIIAHRLSTIRHADIIYIIDQGRIIEKGSFDELCANTSSQFYAMSVQQRLIA